MFVIKNARKSIKFLIPKIAVRLRYKEEPLTMGKAKVARLSSERLVGLVDPNRH